MKDSRLPFHAGRAAPGRFGGARAALAAAALVLGTGAHAVPGIASLLQQLAADPACAEIRTVGPCLCGPVPCGVRVTQFVPVAFIETTRAPGDTLVGAGLLPGGPAAGPLGALAGTASSTLSTTDNTAEAHVWIIPDNALPPPLCAACKPSDAARPAPPVEAASPLCDAAATATQSITGALADLAGPWVPVLAYASEADMLNWRTGCRDLAAVALPAPPCLALPGAAAALAEDSACLGAWGPLKPRQMRDIGPPPVLYSAKTAVRAMSIARAQLGSLPYPVDTSGKLQQVYPAASACFRVGSLPLPELPWSLQPTVTSLDGRYGWVYWRRTTCCVQTGRLSQCLHAGSPGP